MDWTPIVTALVTSLLGTGGLFVFLYKKWIGTHIQKSVSLQYDQKLEEHKIKIQHEHDKKLEEFKANLQKEITERDRQMQENLQKSAVRTNADSELFKKFMSVLPSSSGSINLLKTYNMGDPVPERVLYQLYEFHERWGNPDHCFLDTELDTKRQQLHHAIDKFLSTFGDSTSLHVINATQGFHRISKSLAKKDFKKTMDLLNSLADKIVKIHEDFVKTAREKLNVNFIADS